MGIAQSFGSRDSIFVLDDRRDVVETTTDYFESLGVPTVAADSIDEAWQKLMQEQDNIRVALIDKNIYQERDAGVGFVKEARQRFPEVHFFLITGWTLLQAEREAIEADGIDWLDKGTLIPSNLVALYQHPQVTQLRGRFPSDWGQMVPAPGSEAKEPDATQESTFQSSLRDETIQVLRSENSTLRKAVRAMAGDLVQRLRNDGFSPGEAAIFLDGREWSVEGLVEEIETCTQLGLKLIETHFAVMSDLLKDKRRGGGGD